MDGISVNTIAFIAILVGVILRTVWPFIKKIQEGNQITFDKKYVYTALGAIVATYALMARLLALNPFLAADPLIVALIAFILGWGDNEIINFFVSFIGIYLGKPIVMPEIPEEPEEQPEEPSVEPEST